MKALLALPLLLATACVSPNTVPVSMPVVRTVERVVSRHDTYVLADVDLSAEERSGALSESAEASSLMVMHEIPLALLHGSLSPVMDRYDAYVLSDIELDSLMRDIYLESSTRLRSLMEAAK